MIKIEIFGARHEEKKDLLELAERWGVLERKTDKLKFVVLRDRSGAMVLNFWPGNDESRSHLDLARKIQRFLEVRSDFEEFLGAGEVVLETRRAIFGSATCSQPESKGGYGRDRPPEGSMENAILFIVKKAVEKILAACGQNE
ncbi:MAG: hypothetical protein ABIH35_01450 [Patescibacteria group bacterium]